RRPGLFQSGDGCTSQRACPLTGTGGLRGLRPSRPGRACGRRTGGVDVAIAWTSQTGDCARAGVARTAAGPNHFRRSAPARACTALPLVGAGALRSGGPETVNDRVMGVDVRVQQLQAVVVALRALPPRHDDLGFRTVADRQKRPAFDALADSFGLA